MNTFLQVAVKNPYIVNLASQVKRKVHKRESDYSNIRIHPVFTNISSTASKFLEGDDTPLSRAIDTLQSTLLVHPVQGNLTIPPKCIEYTYGLNKGKCRWSPLPSPSYYRCGEFGVIPQSYIGTREGCFTSFGPCVTKGPNGSGIPNADYLLFVSASSTGKFSLSICNPLSIICSSLVVFLEIPFQSFQLQKFNLSLALSCLLSS